MWDDDVFPTRQGDASGKAMERKMVGSGIGDIRTVIRNNPDGSTTMLRTRNGFPEFTTTGAAKRSQTIQLVESDYLLREYWGWHPLYETMFATLPFKYLKSISLVNDMTLTFASPPADKLENDDYYAAESKRSLDGLLTYFLFHPKRAQVVSNGSALAQVMFSAPGATTGIEYYGYRNVIEDDAVADEAESAALPPDVNSNEYLKNGNSYSRKVVSSLATSSGALLLKDVAK